ncbi:helix-turn-helix domain-containing protein [Vogesella facilis]|uniref:Helix-turn-helix domain-containing protein n=1 Tax=Vogesella facilis TaxID=1655232 RepID=A0ABV7RF41_9NEIS
MDQKNSLIVQIGFEIANRRRLLGMSQEQLAFTAGLHRTYISLVERGCKSPTITTLESIAASLGVPASEILKSAEDNVGKLAEG